MAVTDATPDGKSDRGLVVQRTAVLFVCTGNICRSPMAEAVFRTFAGQAGLPGTLVIDSAGTHDYQLGQPPDPRALAAARRRGYEVPARRARQVSVHDFGRFDWILGMDYSHLLVLETLRPLSYRGHLGLFLEMVPETGAIEVPDPYCGSPQDFEHVLDLLEQGAEALLMAIRKGIAASETR